MSEENAPVKDEPKPEAPVEAAAPVAPAEPPDGPTESERLEMAVQKRVEVAPCVFLSKHKGADGKRQLSFFGSVAQEVARMQASGEDWEDFVRSLVFEYNTGESDGLPEDEIEELHDEEFLRIEEDLWVKYDEEAGCEVRVFNEKADEWEREQKAGTDEDWVTARVEKNTERNNLVAQFLQVTEVRENLERQVQPNAPCPCGKKNAQGNPVKFKKCCMWKRGADE